MKPERLLRAILPDEISAGHIWKFITLAYIPPTIAGIVLAYRGKLLAAAESGPKVTVQEFNAPLFAGPGGNLCHAFMLLIGTDEQGWHEGVVRGS